MIQKLDPLLIQKIAAGEVIESPVSVVKELVENSLDANATKIEVILVNGGKNLIAIKDNGIGMSKEDLMICFERHATSKIISENDLYNISTLGFRGEALSSICAVSHFSIISKQDSQDVGNAIFVTEERLVESKQVNLNKGTTMIIKDLFYNLPVRLNFMKQRSYELRKIIDLVKSYALINENIHFTLIEINNTQINNLINEKDYFLVDDLKYSKSDIIFDSPISTSLKDRVASIYGFNVAKEMIELSNDHSNIFITGLISKPTLYRSSKANIFTYVNNRLVDNKTITNAILDAYSNILSDKYPFVILNLNVPKSFVDVNVHPNKLTIKFTEDGLVYSQIYDVIQNILSSNSLIPSVDVSGFTSDIKNVKPIYNKTYFNTTSSGISSEQSHNSFDSDVKLNSNFSNNSYNNNSSYMDKVRPVSQNTLVNDLSMKKNYFSDDTVLDYDDDTEDNLLISANLDDKSKNNYVLLGQFANSYVLIQKDDKLLILDQHVIEERINYEKFTAMFLDQGISKQNLLQPLVINLQPEDVILVDENKELFESIGIDIDAMGNDSVIVRSLPYILKEQSDNTIVFDIIAYLRENSRSLNAVEHIKDEMIKQISCKASIKQGEPLTNAYMTKIVDELFTMQNPYVCPHGRPVIVELSLDELNKMFKRK